MDLMREPVSALKESIRFRFKTNQANGVVMYSRGTQNDYFAMQMRENRMLLNINLGVYYYCERSSPLPFPPNVL